MYRHSEGYNRPSSDRLWRSCSSNKTTPMSGITDRFLRSAAVTPRSHPFPPSPTVEEEVVSLSREVGFRMPLHLEGEPICRGDLDQCPIILENETYNSITRSPPSPIVNKLDLAVSDDDGYTSNQERRYVLLSSPSDTKASDVRTLKSLPTPIPPKTRSYEANTRRKVSSTRIDNNLSDKSDALKVPGVVRRKSRLELPRINTEVDDRARPQIGRSKSAAPANPGLQIEQEANDYFQPRARTSTFLSPAPAVIKHATRGRDRAYFDFSPHPEASGEARPRLASEGPGLDRERRSSHHLKHRTFPDRQHRSKHDPALQAERRSDINISRGGRISQKILTPPATPRLDRRQTSPGRDQRWHMRNDSVHRRQKSGEFRERCDLSSGDEYSGAMRPSQSRRTSFIGRESRDHLMTPVSAPPLARGSSQSRIQMPLHSPRVSQSYVGPPDSYLNPRTSYVSYGSGSYVDETTPDSPFSTRSCSPELSREDKSRGARSHQRLSGALDHQATRPTPKMQPLHSERRRSAIGKPRLSRNDSMDSTSSRLSWHSVTKVPISPGPAPSHPRTPLEKARIRDEAVSKCLRPIPKSGYAGWLTIPKAEGFRVCTNCWNAHMGVLNFKDHAISCAHIFRNSRVACSLGSLDQSDGAHWYRIAWSWTLQFKIHNLRILQNVHHALSAHTPCAGPDITHRSWLCIKDPVNDLNIPNFRVCSSCVSVIKALFPEKFEHIFTHEKRSREQVDGICSMHYSPEVNTFSQLLDAFEKAYDDALLKGSEVNLWSLAKQIRHVTSFNWCESELMLSKKKWHRMPAIPGFMVCEECYQDVVKPLALGGSSIAQLFRPRSQLEAEGQCQLYSANMRRTFQNACKTEDFGLLHSRVLQRNAKGDQMREYLRRCEKAPVLDVRHAEELNRVLAEWEAMK